MTSGNTNYGVILADTGGTIGEVVSIDPPEYMTAAIESTNHGSGGVREFVSGGLSEMSQFKTTVNYVKANIASLVTKKNAGTKSTYTITFPGSQGVQSFSALVTSIKPLPADAQKPEMLKAEITFQPSDALGLS